MTPNDLCDDILRTCLTKVQLNPQFTLQKMYASRGIPEVEVDAMLLHLSANPPGYLARKGGHLVLTPDGEQFIKSGGYAAKQQREAEAEISAQRDRELTRLVGQSVIDTNSSVVKTHGFQRKSTLFTLAVAIAALTVSIAAFFKGEDKSQLESLRQQQVVTQRKLDSLQAVLSVQQQPDTLNRKHLK